MRSLLSLRTWFFALSVLLLAQSSSAAPGVVHLKDGRSLVVDILEVHEGNYLLIRDSNGNDFTIEWPRIQSFEPGASVGELEPNASPSGTTDTSSTAPPSAQAVAPNAATVPTYAASPLVTPTASMALHGRIGLLDRKIERLEDDMPSIGGPIVMTSVGFGVGSVLLFMGIAGSNDCRSSYCNREPFTIMSVLGGVGIAAGIGGVVLLVRAVENRKPFREELRALETERDALESQLDAAFVPGGALGTWSLTF